MRLIHLDRGHTANIHPFSLPAIKDLFLTTHDPGIEIPASTVFIHGRLISSSIFSGFPAASHFAHDRSPDPSCL